MPPRVLIAGVSTRAAAESAARAGFRPTAIDAFLDLDQHPSVVARSPAGPYSAGAAAKASRDLECDAVVYLSGFENEPAAVEELASNRVLWGNRPEELLLARDPEAVYRAFVGRGHPAPRVVCGAIASDPADPTQSDFIELMQDRTWLSKPRAAGGGHGVEPWTGLRPIDPGRYLQEFVPGVAGSIAFVAARGRAVTLGVSRQLVGDSAFGASGFQYCGSVLTLGGAGFGGSGLIDAASRLAVTAAGAFGLVGVNGIDFVERNGVPHPVEINPRWCASMELVELAFGFSVFAAHAEACASGVLPPFDTDPLQIGRGRTRGSGAIGKAIVFAIADVVIGDTTSWRSAARGNIRDVPRPGTRIRAGRPVCTVVASGRDDGECYGALRERSREIYRRLDGWRAEGEGAASFEAPHLV